jgi:hypothetical protein
VKILWEGEADRLVFIGNIFGGWIVGGWAMCFFGWDEVDGKVI